VEGVALKLLGTAKAAVGHIFAAIVTSNDRNVERWRLRGFRLYLYYPRDFE
jgi:hypothetical protein